MVKNAHEIKGKIGENLRAWIPDAEKTRDLVTICRTVPVPYDYKECEIDLKWDNATEIFSDLEFNSYLTKIKRGGFYNAYQ
ncbi:DNA polymerase I [compost metagenome]